MRTLAVDLGTRRIGLALSDEGGRFASPLEVLEVTSRGAVAAAVERVVRREGVQRLVIGVPVNMDDTLGPAAHDAIAWGRDLAARTGADLVLVDERLSSFEAEQQLIARKRAGEKLTRQRKKQQLDAIAAAGFLQAFLDGRLPPLSV